MLWHGGESYMSRVIKKLKLVLIVSMAIALTGCGKSKGDAIVLKTEEIQLEVDNKIDRTISNYIDGSDSVLSQVIADFSEVDTSKIGRYQVSFSYNEELLFMKVNVVDSTPPEMTIGRVTVNLCEGVPLSVDKLAVKYTDYSECHVAFEDGKVEHIYNEAGTYSENIVVTDLYGNKSQKSLTVYVGSEYAPTLIGVGDLTYNYGQPIDTMRYISAYDSEKNDLTSKIKVSTYDARVRGQQTLTYTVSDNWGNTTTKTCVLTIN